MVHVVSTDALGDYVGEELGVSEWFLIDQDRINRFADVTEDHQFIHVDPAKARQTPYGTTIAHGFLSLSLLPYLCADISVTLDGVVMGVNYGFDKVRFVQPVPVNSEVRARTKLLDIQEKKRGQIFSKIQVTVEIKDSPKPALIAEWLTLQMLA